jgi:1-acyl-sn-glycerol-3-phosphate acyltransferase
MAEVEPAEPAEPAEAAEPVEPADPAVSSSPATVDESPPTWGRRLWYSFVRNLIVCFCRLFWRLEVHGSANVPGTGPFILSPVHRSNVDTPLVCAVTSRRLRYIGKDAMWKYRWSAWFFTSLGGWAVHRGTPDREAMKRAADRLNEGQPVVLFPEGTRQSGPVVEHLFDGPAYMACRTGAPIVPVGIGGSEQAMPKGAKMIRPVKLVLVVGEPIHPPAPSGGRISRRAVREVTGRLRSELQRRFDEAQERAGTPNRYGSGEGGEDVAGRASAVVEPGPALDSAAERRTGDHVDGAEQLP